MTGCETDEPNQHQLALTVGSDVEVSNDEGLKGAWFRATIIEYPDNSASRKTKRALVVYKTLVTKDGSKPLKEYVALARLRRLPPAIDDKQDFVEGDVVDVDYKDGWRTGVIKKVMGNSKYRVFFENPLDLIEFEHKNLRFHQDLVGEDWFRPERQQTTASTFSSGNDVEVNFDKQDLDEAWLPAVVVKENEDNTYLVKYQKSESEYEQEIVDSLHIRLPHPSYSDRRYKLQEKIVACDIQEELEHTPKTAFASTSQLNSPGAAKDIIEQEKTPSIRSRTNQEQSPHRKRKIVSVCLTQSIKKAKLSTSSGNEEYFNTPEMLKDLMVEEVPFSIPAHHMTEETICSLPTSSPTPSSKPARAVRLRKPVNRYQFYDETGRLQKEKKVSTKQQKDGELDNQRKDPIRRRGRPSKSRAKNRLAAAVGKEDDTSCSEEEGITKEAELPLTIGSSVTRLGSSVDENPQQPTDDDSLTVIEDAKKYSIDPVDKNTMVLNQQQDGGNSHKRKRGRPRKLVIPDSSEDLKDASIKKKAEVSGNEASDNADKEDWPLSTWFGGMQGPTGNKPTQHIDAKNGTYVTVQANEIVSKDSQGFPFVKSSPLWETITSMSVFSTMPQNPHFEPLNNCKEEYREGLAIGSMVTFSNLVKRISNMQFEDPGSTFTSILDSLIYLEKHGFDVTVLRTRVNELVSIKDRQGQFVNESKNCESMMAEHTREKTILVKEMDNISKKISESQKKHALLASKLEKREIDIEKLKFDMDAMNKSIETARLDFEKLAAASLYSA